ncbi:MAG: NAD(P)-dependent alcohol dehydrogenase [Betaproteobacteria bacterium]|nr:NAD(P)-dependent alcohol dehydrogenase [Betaproteobacteria bacterium]
MKAVVCERYGPPEVLRLTETATPQPRDNELLIRIHATTVTFADRRIRAMDAPPGFGVLMRLAFGVSRPRQPVLGSELAGVVDAVGSAVHAFRPGDRVFAFADARLGCHAEYRCLPDNALVARMPANLDFAHAAALSFGGTTALSFLRRAKVRRGEQVLINGASGGVGTAAIQLARHLGAEVTAVCSAANADLVSSLGAARVIDYAREDFTQLGECWDVIMDTVGTAPYSRASPVLRPGGRLLAVLAGLQDMLTTPLRARLHGRRVIAGPAFGTTEDLRHLAQLAEAGVFLPVIDREFPLERIVEAHRHVDTGRKRGNVIIHVTDSLSQG